MQCVCICIGGTPLRLGTSTHYFLPHKVQFSPCAQLCGPAQYSWTPNDEAGYSRQTQAETSLYRQISRPLHIMSAQDSSSNYLEQMGSLFNTVSSYMRLPVLISSVHSLPRQPFIPTLAARWHFTYRYGRASPLC